MHILHIIMNKKCIIGVVGVIVFCVILGVLLGVLLPRRGTEEEEYNLQELPENSTWYGNEEIRIFRQYLTIKTVHPDIDYEPCVRFLKKQAASLDLPVSVYYPRNDKNPVVVMTWLGSDPDLKSIMLNSHTDVVPVFEELWSHPPFAADVDEQGRIYARGSQDTKALGMIYLAAIRAIKKDGIKQLKRTFHITFVPDEEMGGYYGMDAFANSEEFKAMDVGFALDEARVSVNDTIIATNDERCSWRIEFVFHGVTGHGSILFQNTTGEKMNKLVNKLMERRQIEVTKLNASNGDYTGGVQGNVIPPELSVVFDVRLAVNADHAEFERELNQWCEDAGGNITINYAIKDPKAPMTRADETNPVWVVLNNTAREFGLGIAARATIGGTDARFMRRLNQWCEDAGGNITINYAIKDPKAPMTRADETNPVWVVLNNTAREFGLGIAARATIGGTDARFMRRLNISAFGFSPIINTPILLHADDEYVGAKEYLDGINIYKEIILKLGDI